MAEQFDDVQQLIVEVCDDIKEMLLGKNRQYGNSVVDPVRIFSKADPIEQIKVRLDDKLSRISRGDPTTENEDVNRDIIGYLILWKVAKMRQQK